jgi:hypothetical protein
MLGLNQLAGKSWCFLCNEPINEENHGKHNYATGNQQSMWEVKAKQMVGEEEQDADYADNYCNRNQRFLHERQPT